MYKKSRYTHIITIAQQIYYVNLLTGMYFPMKPEEHQKMKPLFADPITFELEYPTVFKQFYKWGFFVDSEIQEDVYPYYRFLETYINDPALRIVIFSDQSESPGNDFVERLEKYITQTLNSSFITSVTLEWNGNHLLEIKELIASLCAGMKQICHKKEVQFQNILNVAVSSDRIIHNKLFHKKGIPTYEKYLSSIESMGNEFPDLHMNLMVVYMDEQERKIFTKKFIDKENVTVSCMDITKSNPEYNAVFYVKKDDIHCPAKNLILINTKGDVFSSYPHYQRQRNVGKLTEEGIIHWENQKRERELAIPWFLNKVCKRCKYLPLLNQVCYRYQVRENIIVCPVKSRLISVKDIIRLTLGKLN